MITSACVSDDSERENLVSCTLKLKSKAKTAGASNFDESKLCENMESSSTTVRNEMYNVKSFWSVEPVPNLEETVISGDGDTLTIRKYVWVDVSLFRFGKGMNYIVSSCVNVLYVYLAS